MPPSGQSFSAYQGRQDGRGPLYRSVLHKHSCATEKKKGRAAVLWKNGANSDLRAIMRCGGQTPTRTRKEDYICSDIAGCRDTTAASGLPHCIPKLAAGLTQISDTL